MKTQHAVPPRGGLLRPFPLHFFDDVRLDVWRVRADALRWYKENRGNGDAPGWFVTFPLGDQIPDQFYSWTTPVGRRFPVQRDPKDKDYFLCPFEVQYKKADGYWYADLRLDESPEMRQCMERRDIEYLRNLEREGHLLELEPYADLEIAEDHAFKTEIRAVMERARGMPSLKLFCAFFINRNPEAQALLMQVKSYLPITLYSFLRRLPNIRAAEERAETTLAVQYKRAAETREAEPAPKTARLEK